MKSQRISLFPLEVVLFPGMPLPLHIFEPRYKQMVSHCLQIRAEFGVNLAKPEGFATVGCTAEIVKVVKKYADGRMDILTAGQTPYRVLEVFEDQPYLQADVEYIEEDLEPPATKIPERLVTLYEQCHKLIFGRPPQLPDPGSGVPVTFQIASALPLDLDYKQELLETRMEIERQNSLLERMDRWLPELTRLNHMRRKAGGNGHGLG